ncbi:MAG: pyocin knob domain-containing protein, partial [Peptostreptococcaceae bacterium]
LTNDSGYLTTLPTHNHNDLYYSKIEVDGKIPTVDVTKAYVDGVVGSLPTLTTTNKTSTVGAINELDNEIGNLSIDRGYLNSKDFLDADLLINNGKYTGNGLNTPYQAYWNIDVVRHTDVFVTQTAHRFASYTGVPDKIDQLWIRHRSNGKWTTWQQVATTTKMEISPRNDWKIHYAHPLIGISGDVVVCNMRLWGGVDTIGATIADNFPLPSNLIFSIPFKIYDGGTNGIIGTAELTADGSLKIIEKSIPLYDIYININYVKR